MLTEVLGGRRTGWVCGGSAGVERAADARLLVRYGDGGGGALIHRARGRTTNNQLASGVREYVLELIRRQYRDFRPTLAAEVLEERHGINIGRETVRKWMVEAGLWSGW